MSSRVDIMRHRMIYSTLEELTGRKLNAPCIRANTPDDIRLTIIMGIQHV